MTTVISVENLSKTYRLGQIGTGTFTHDLAVWWAKVRGKPNPLLKIGETDHGNRDGEELWALKDVSFTVEQGEVLGIIGKNGAGKSTLLKILSRVTAPTSGKVKVKGRIASLLEVGTGFHPELTGRENVYLNGAILGMTRQEVTRKFDEIVDFAGVEKFIDTPVKRYSSGMYVRLAFAVAAHLDPEILVVDEVLAVGDAEFQKKCLGKMGEVAHEGRTVLFVSHNMAAIQTLCNESLLFSRGCLIEYGQTHSVITNYLSDTSSGFVFDTANSGTWVQNIVLQNNVQKDADVFQTGDRVVIKARISASKKITRFYFGIDLFDEWENLVFAFHSKETGLVVDKKIDSDFNIEIDIPSLFLLPGKYHLRLILVDRDGSVLEDIKKIKTLEIISKDYSGSGFAYTRAHGQVFIPHKMRLTSDEYKWEIDCR